MKKKNKLFKLQKEKYTAEKRYLMKIYLKENNSWRLGVQEKDRYIYIDR